MRHLLTLLLLAASAFGQTATISDTIRTPFGGTFSGTVTVSLNSPALAQPLYSGNVTLSGWTQTVTVTAGVFTLTLYTNDLITPGGTSYTATFAPSSGSGWKETWIVPTGATTIREIRSTTVPSPSVRFTPSQITQAGATLGQGLRWSGSIWAPATFVADPMTATGDLITRSGGVPVRVGIGSTNQVLTVSGGMPVWANGITGNASTATALAADPANCSAGTLPRGVDASGAGQGCAAVALTSEVTGILPNANTTAASTNTASAIVARDASGNFAAGTVTAALAGNASTATALQTARTIAGVAFDGSANISIPYSGLTGAPALAAIATSGSASDLSTGTVPAARGGAGAVSGLLKADGAGLVSAAVAGTDFVVPAGNVATATALQTARTIAGTSFDGTANINIASTGLSDSANLVRNNAANTYTSGSKQTFASNATTAGAAFGGGITADPSSVTAGDFWYRADLGTFGFRNASAVDALVAGGRALTTVGSVPFVTAAGVLGQSANLFWDNANGRLGIGRNNPSTVLHVEAANPAFTLTRTAISNLTIANSGSGVWSYTANGGQGLSFGVTGGAEWARLAPTTGNLLLGTTTDGNFRFDVASSGSSGTARIYDQTPTTGSTSLVVRAGAGQSGNLQTWQNAAGTGIANVDSIGRINSQIGFLINTSGGAVLSPFAGALGSFARGFAVGWGDASDAAVHASGYLFRGTTGTTTDLSLSRASAGVLQVGDGGANANGTVNAASARLNGGGFTVENTAVNLGSVSVSSNARQLLITGQPQDPTLGMVAPLTVNAVANGAANRKLFQLGIAGVEAFSVDVEGDVVANGVMSIGTALNNAFRLDVGSSGSSGTARIYDQGGSGSTSFVVRGGAAQSGNLFSVRNSGDGDAVFVTATGSGVTASHGLVVRAGAGQGSNNLQTWQNSAGTALAFINFGGSSIAQGFLTSNFVDLGSTGGIRFSDSADPGTAKDIAARRRAAGLLSLDSGTAIGTTPGNARDIMARGFYAAETSTDPSAADLTIAGSNAQDVAAIYVKNDKLVVAYNRSGTVNYLTIPLDGATTTFTQSTTAP